MLRRLLHNYPDLVETAGGRADIKGIHYTARWGHIVSVTLLRDSGASMDSKDLGSWTPLAYAIQGHHINIVTYLLSQQADPNVKASNGAAMLMLARRVEFDAGLAALNQYHATKILVCDNISELHFSTLFHPR
jgi:ankyrin repeat protein